LEQQKVLSEKLENDLFSVNKHKLNGDLVHSESGGLDTMAALDLRLKPAVNYPFSLAI
jgi:homeobox protein cut-like